MSAHIIRGQVWRYEPVLARPGQSRERLIVSAQPINDSDDLAAVLGVQVERDDPGGLLAVNIGDLGWVSAMTVQPVLRSRLTEPLTTLSADTLAQVDAALRIALTW